MTFSITFDGGFVLQYFLMPAKVSTLKFQLFVNLSTKNFSCLACNKAGLRSTKRFQDFYWTPSIFKSVFPPRYTVC